MKLLPRLAEVDDLPEILQLQRLSMAMLLADTYAADVLEALIEQQQKEREKRDELIIVATCNHRIVGFIALLYKTAQITGLFIHPDFVRQGIATELVRAAEDIFLTQNRQHSFVWSSEYAKPFYKKCGFQVLHSRYLLLGRHRKVRIFRMKKQLRELSEQEEQQQNILLTILGLLLVISLWAAIA